MYSYSEGEEPLEDRWDATTEAGAQWSRMSDEEKTKVAREECDQMIRDVRQRKRDEELEQNSREQREIQAMEAREQQGREARDRGGYRLSKSVMCAIFFHIPML